MKKVVILFVALVAFAGAASAQTLGNLLKGAVTELVDQKTDGKVTEYLLAASWDYAEPAVRIESENELATLAGNAMVEGIAKKLTSAYNLVGIKADNHTLTLNTDDTFSMKVGNRTLTGTYTYDNETHAIVFNFDTKLVNLSSLNGYAYISGDNLEVVYDCNKLVNFLKAIGSKVSVLEGLTNFLNKYDNVMVGFAYNRN